MIFVTGGAGFIGSNFVLDWLKSSDEPVLNLDKLSYVYIFDSSPHLFIGVTGDLEKRAAQPRRKLVWFEPHTDLAAAVEREKQLKKWNRAWKAKLVTIDNPEWRDLYHDFSG